MSFSGLGSALGYAAMGVLTNGVVRSVYEWEFYPKDMSVERSFYLVGIFAGGTFGAILPHAHMIRKPLQSLGINRDIQDLTHLFFQITFPIFVSIMCISQANKIGLVKPSYRSLVPYLFLDVTIFSLELLSENRWKDLKEVVIPSHK